VLKRIRLKEIERSRLTCLLATAVIAAAVVAYTSIGGASPQTATTTRDELEQRDPGAAAA
jgi:hypothetical protein